jgi:tetraacyldisaccharide 4'-kinase
VISVGNLSVGGTGKTPTVSRIIEILLDLGRRPCIASRGYGRGKHRGDQADEVLAYRDRFPDVTVIARPDRVEGLLEHFHSDAGSSTDVVVLDDGFQHRRLARQMDVVLVDVARPFLHDALLPAGWLREPATSLARATHVLLTHADQASPAELGSLHASIREHTEVVSLGHAKHVWANVVVFDSRASHATQSHQDSAPRHDRTWLHGRKVLAVCGIGHPEPFLRAAERATGAPVQSVILPDHASYSRVELDRVRFALDAVQSPASREPLVLLTTSKDWVKLRAHLGTMPDCVVAVPTLGLEITGGDQSLLEAIQATLDAFSPD